MRRRKGGGGSNSLSVSGLKTKRTNSRKIPRFIPVAESEAKLFSSETRDYCQWIHYFHRNRNIVLWWSCGYYHWICYYYRRHKIVLWWSYWWLLPNQTVPSNPAQFSLTPLCSPPFLIILNFWFKINSPEAWVKAINSFTCRQIKFIYHLVNFLITWGKLFLFESWRNFLHRY